MARIYDTLNRGRSGIHTIFFTPAKMLGPKDGEAPKDWFDQNGKPLQFPVRFRNGVAHDVEDRLAKLLIEKGQARKTRPIIHAD